MLDINSDNPLGVSIEHLGSLDEEQALAIYSQGEQAVVFALLAIAKQLADQDSAAVNPATPSGMVPVYQKPPAKKRKNKSGAKADHAGSHRAKPDRIDHRKRIGPSLALTAAAS